MRKRLSKNSVEIISNSRRKKKVACLFAIALIGSTQLLTGCSDKKSEESEETKDEIVFEELRVETEKPSTQSVVNLSEFMGSVTTQDTVTVSAKVSGEIIEKNFEEGDYVNAGDLLFRIDDTPARQSVASAEAAYQSTKSSVDSMLGTGLDSQAIASTGSYRTSEVSLDTAQYNLDDVCSRLGQARRDLEDTNSAISDLEHRVDELSDELEGACENPIDNAGLIQELQSDIASVSAELSAKKATKATLEATRDSLASQEHAMQNNVKTAQIGLDTSTANLKELVTKGVDETLSKASTTLNQAQVTVNNARQSLDNYSVKSPVSGKIMSTTVEQYGIASPGVSSYVILPDETKKVTFYVSESSINNIYVGQSLTADYAGNTFRAQISEIKDEIDPATGMFKVDATFEGNQNLIYVGASVKVTLETARAENTLTIPLDAVYYESETPYVYIDENGIAKKVYIETGLYDDEKIQVIGGVDTDTSVITTWSAKLKDGERVNGVN